MNTSLLASVKWIITRHGEAILGDPLRLKPIFSKFAKNEPKEERTAFGRCIEMGFYKELKKAKTEDERKKIKGVLIQKLHSAAKFDIDLCSSTVDLLDAAIFGNVVQSQITQVQKTQVIHANLPVNTAQKFGFSVFRKRIVNKKTVRYAGLGIIIITALLLSVTFFIKYSRQNAVIQELIEAGNKEKQEREDELRKIIKYQEELTGEIERLKSQIEDQEQLADQIEQLKKQVKYQEQIAAQLSQLKKQVETQKQSSTSTSVAYLSSLAAAQKTKENFHDVNRDGKWTCIDYALLYKQYYGDGTQARLIWNNNPSKKFNHLFCAIPDDSGGWIYIEPSSTRTALNERTMSYVWGNTYNPNLNRDVTYAYYEIRNNTFRWVW
jgi:hypothetical protein